VPPGKPPSGTRRALDLEVHRHVGIGQAVGEHVDDAAGDLLEVDALPRVLGQRLVHERDRGDTPHALRQRLARLV